MNSAYNQMPLEEQSRRLTQFVIGNQQYDFNRLFYGISIGPAAFSAFMSKIFRPLILKKKAITYLDDVFMQSQTKDDTRQRRHSHSSPTKNCLNNDFKFQVFTLNNSNKR